MDNFRRILDIVLPERNKEYVLYAIKRLERRDDIAYAGPDYYMELCALPDPMPPLANAYQMAALNNMSLPAAWDISIGSNSIMVGVLDSGIHADHFDLTGKVNTSMSRDFTTNTTHGNVASYGLVDPHGHGTHVGGIITNNGINVIGTCWDLQLVSLRVFDSSGSLGNNASRVRYAIDFATAQYIPILNYSGRVLSTYTGFTDIYARLQSYPGLFVCAADNDNGQNNDTTGHFPSNYTTSLNNVIAVGALDGNNVASYSNIGSITVDLFAPGTSIYSTYKDGWYEPKSGTSMATPYVAGIAAMVKAIHPFMTAAQLKTVLRASVDVLNPQLTGKCNTNGKINASKAVKREQLVGTIDIVFDGGSGLKNMQNTTVGPVLAGKFHLFTDGTYVIAERGVYSTPMKYHKTSDPDYFYDGITPTAITNYLNQSGRGTMTVEFDFLFPSSDSQEGINYWKKPFRMVINNPYNSLGYEIEYTGSRFSQLEYYINSTDKRKIRTGNGW